MWKGVCQENRSSSFLARESNTCDLSQKSQTHCNSRKNLGVLELKDLLRCSYLSVELLWVQKSFSGKQSRGKMTLQERPKVQKPRRELRGGAVGTLSGQVLSCKWAWRPSLYLTIEHRSRGGRTQQGEEVCEEEL